MGQVVKYDQIFCLKYSKNELRLWTECEENVVVWKTSLCFVAEMSDEVIMLTS